MACKVLSEFDLIARYFTRPARNAILGVGDDAALLQPSPGMVLAVTADMLVVGRHFFPDTDPGWLGHKSLAVNLSDLAAMGARPRWALLSIALPEINDAWLAAFSGGLFGLADQYGVELVGGDTTRGPLNISLTLLGEVASGRALRRDGARLDDDIWVSGELGGAALGLLHARGILRLDGGQAEQCCRRLHQPEPRVGLGRELVGLAHAAIDISDGLVADLGHMVARSQVGARIELDRLPMEPALHDFPDRKVDCALAGGDDYELCFTAPPTARQAVLAAGQNAGVAVNRIGKIDAAQGVRVVRADGQEIHVERTGFDHFVDPGDA